MALTILAIALLAAALVVISERDAEATHRRMLERLTQERNDDTS